MKLKTYFAVLLMLAITTGFAQSKPKLKFSDITQIGILSGESSAEYQMQTINGIRYKTITAGVGIGLDNYYEQTIPLFFDLRKNFYGRPSTPFVYVDAGYSFLPKGSKLEWEMDSKGGAYYAAGIGYELPLDRKVKAVFDIGYSYKHFSRIVDNEPWRSSIHNFDTYNYSLNRITIKAGLRF
jgi:hypothetical protein